MRNGKLIRRCLGDLIIHMHSLLSSTEKMNFFNVDFEPVGKRGKCRDDESLLNCARRSGIGIVSLCGGRGKCHDCKVQILRGSTSKPTSNERESFSPQELRDGYRLAC